MSSENTNSPEEKTEEETTFEFPLVVKYATPATIQIIDFKTKDGQQGPRKLVAINPATNEAFVLVQSLDTLQKLSTDEEKAIVEWQQMLQQKGAILGGNIVIDPVTGEVKAGPGGPQMPGKRIIGG